MRLMLQYKAIGSQGRSGPTRELLNISSSRLIALLTRGPRTVLGTCVATLLISL